MDLALDLLRGTLTYFTKGEDIRAPMQSSGGWHARFRAIRIRARGRRNSSSAVYEPRKEETVGAFLRRCRETRHETLNHVSQALRIRVPYLKAIEECEWQALPNSVYARAFLRSYAIHVEADPDQVLSRAEAALESKPGPDTPLPPMPARDRSLPGGALIGASVLLAIAAYAGWYYFSVQQLRDERVVAALPDRLMTELAPAERAALVSPQRVSGRLGAANPLPGQPSTTGPAPPAEDADSAAGLEPGEPPGPTASDVRPGLPAIAAPFPAESSSRGRMAGGNGTGDAASVPEGVVFHAVEPTYIEVRSVETDEVLVGRLLVAGERYRVPDRRGLVLSVGNAGGLEVTVDGVPIPRLGAAGAVLRHIPIDGDLLLRSRTGG